MRDAYPRIRERGAELVVVGNGSSAVARAFQEAERLPFALFTDPELGTHRALGLKSGPLTGLRPRVALNALRAARGGFRQGATLGPAWQQGGVFVLGPGDVERYRYLSREAGDHPAIEAILEALA